MAITPLPCEVLPGSEPTSPVFAGLRTEVQRYFTDNDLKMQGPRQMYVKSAIILVSWFATYCLLMLYGPRSVAVSVVGVLVLAFWTTAIEFSVMHDVSHSSFSDRKLLNTCMNVWLTFIGACSMLWHQKHVVRHHGNTNVIGVDADIDSDGMFRFKPTDDWRPYHSLQHIYAWLFYAFIALEWFWYSDIRQTVHNTFGMRGKQYAWLWAELLVSKVSHIVIFFVFPYLFFHSVWVVLALYLAHWLPAGLFISVVFQLAHVGPMQVFPERRNSIGDWAEHQLKTTADFAVDNPFLTWVAGGLNFQVEHHIFPRISHIHYPQLQRIVKRYCQHNHVPYHEFPGFWTAVAAHYDHLRGLSYNPAALPERQAA